ncbi:beta-lactamase family protein [Saccharibacillus sp. CPCC 101409]|uniref:beta-lactamase family protein n=1 Tax=Saccharibacillus sp. CPCC 101409 TaxID=3058041 RepID=UPI002673F238|nr:beta-lactamase family protein [Saccharibacillus sp. CPCC 101409]MDO3409394.1 beta-lactamase family protein [Saccharibacillus sp. CPCC 101409]
MPEFRKKNWLIAGALLIVIMTAVFLTVKHQGGEEGRSQSPQKTETKAEAKTEVKTEAKTAVNEDSAGRAAQANGPNNPAEVEQFIDSVFNRTAVQNRLQGAGVVVTVVGNGTALLSKGYGYADIETRAPVDADRTLFRIGSITKTVTAAAVMQLADQGKIDLEQDVQTYMNGLTFADDAGTPVTMADLLTHTSGFDYTEGPVVAGKYKDAEALDAYVKHYMPSVIRQPGTVYRYDNFGYNLQGYIVQQVAGAPYEETLRRNLFEPLAMNDSGFDLNEETKNRLATAYDSSMQKIESLPTNPLVSPTGGMLTTGADMGKFMLAMLGRTNPGGVQVLSGQSLEKMESAQFGFSAEMPNTTYGLAYTAHQLNNDEEVVGKGGNLPGFASHLWLLPERGVGVFISTNNDAYDAAPEFFRDFMNHYYPSQTKAASSETAPGSVDLQAYEGIYRDLRTPELYVNVRAANDRLEMQSNAPMSVQMNLVPSGENMFVDLYGNRIGFRLDEEGRGRYLNVDSEGSWYERLPDYPAYKDVKTDSPYADSINAERLMGLSPAESEPNFRPEQPVTRSEFAWQIGVLTHLAPSKKPSRFDDTESDPNTAWIELLAELGAFGDSPGGSFRPQDPITREEAAQIVYLLVDEEVPADIELTEQPSEAAREAVEFMIQSQFYGPEVTRSESGRYDYRPFDPLLRQEMALMIVKMSASRM